MTDAPMTFDGRTALITGAGSGIGRAHALALADRGAAVVINELPSTIERAEEVRDAIETRGGRAVTAAGTVGNDDDARAMVETAIRTFGSIDIVVNNAGIPGGVDSVPIQLAPTDRQRRFLDIHVAGPMQINRAAWPHMLERDYGRILFVSSAGATGWSGATNFEADYAGMKAAVLAVARQTAGAGRSVGIVANTLMPWAYSRMVSASLGGTAQGEWMEQHLKPEHVAAGALYLLHEDCPVTGEAFTVGGGRVARVLFAETRGLFDAALTPETVRDRWSEVMGTIDEEGRMVEAFELSAPRGAAVIERTIAEAAVPDLAWIASLPVQQPHFSVTRDPKAHRSAL